MVRIARESLEYGELAWCPSRLVWGLSSMPVILDSSSALGFGSSGSGVVVWMQLGSTGSFDAVGKVSCWVSEDAYLGKTFMLSWIFIW